MLRIVPKMYALARFPLSFLRLAAFRKVSSKAAGIELPAGDTINNPVLFLRRRRRAKVKVHDLKLDGGKST